VSRIIIWFENQAYHAGPAYLHEFYSLYSQCLQSNATSTGTCNLIADRRGKQSSPLYRVYNHPIPMGDERISFDSILQKVADIGISMTILCAYAFIPAGFIVFTVRERITQEKRLQYVCGVKPFLYWLSSFVWDFSYFMIIILLTIGVIGVFGNTAYTANMRNFSSMIVLLVLFGWASLPMAYILSRFFSDVGSAYMIVFCFTLFTGVLSCVTVFLLSFVTGAGVNIALAELWLKHLFLVLPSYNLGIGLIDLSKNQILAETYAMFGIDNVYIDPFSFDMLGIKYLSLAVSGFGFFIILMILESRIDFMPCFNQSSENVNCFNFDVFYKCYEFNILF
jgi:hypothetical protein